MVSVGEMSRFFFFSNLLEFMWTGRDSCGEVQVGLCGRFPSASSFDML